MCKDYRGIQERVMNNGMVMRETQIQLPDINQTTLSQWYIKRQKKKEQEILKQGLPQRTEPAASKTPLPAAIPLPPSLPQVNYPVPFKFVLPTNTTGTAVLRGQTSKACQPMPILPAPVPPVTFLQPPTVVRRFPPVPIQSKIQTQHHQPQSWQQKSQSQPSVHSQQKDETRTTQEQKASTSRKRSSYNMVCSKCGKKKDPENHKQYFGNWYCNTMTESFETWRENLKNNKEYKKKKTD